VKDLLSGFDADTIPGVFIASKEIVGYSEEMLLTPIKCPTKKQFKNSGILTETDRLSNYIKVGDDVQVRKAFSNTNPIGGIEKIYYEGCIFTVTNKDELIKITHGDGNYFYFEKDDFNKFFEIAKEIN